MALGRDIKRLLHSFLFFKLPRWPQDVAFHQNDTAPHFPRTVSYCLDKEIGSRWIGRGSSVAWPSEPAGLISSDFSLGLYQ